MTSKCTGVIKKEITAPELLTSEQVLKEKHEAEFQLKLNWEKVDFSIRKSLMKISRIFAVGIDECFPRGEVSGVHGKVFVSTIDDMPGVYEVTTWSKLDQVLKVYKNRCESKYHNDVLEKINAAIAKGGKSATKVAKSKDSVVKGFPSEDVESGSKNADEHSRIDNREYSWKD